VEEFDVAEEWLEAWQRAESGCYAVFDDGPECEIGCTPFVDFSGGP